MQRWEYLAVRFDPNEEVDMKGLRAKPFVLGEHRSKSRPAYVADLNTLGADGWEAVGVSLETSLSGAKPFVLLKRALPES